MSQRQLFDKNYAQTHSNLGKNFEADLERTHQYYAMQKRAKVNKNPKEWQYSSDAERQKILAQGVRGMTALVDDGCVLVSKKSDVDFSGTAGRLHVEFDAKETRGKSLDLKKNVKRHQLETLVLTETCGGIAGLMIHFSDLKRVFFVRASVVDKAVTEMLFKNGRKSLPLAVCETDGAEIPVKNNLIDWLGVLTNR